MKFSHFTRILWLPALFLVFIGLSALIQVPVCNAATYTIDPEHSRVEFRVKHMGIGWVNGEFKSFVGTFVYTPEDLKKAYVDATIRAFSLDTGTFKRDQHLKSSVFLNTQLFGNIRFLSSRVEEVSPDNFKIFGVLTIKSTAKEVVLDVTHGGNLIDPWGIPRAAFHATTTINRKDFGLTWNRVLEAGALLVGEEVEITLDIQGVEVKDTTPKLLDPSSSLKKQP